MPKKATGLCSLYCKILSLEMPNSLFLLYLLRVWMCEMDVNFEQTVRWLFFSSTFWNRCNVRQVISPVLLLGYKIATYVSSNWLK